MASRIGVTFFRAPTVPSSHSTITYPTNYLSSIAQAARPEGASEQGRLESLHVGWSARMWWWHKR